MPPTLNQQPGPGQARPTPARRFVNQTVLWLLCGLVSACRPAAPTLAPAQLDQVYHRATNHFANTVLFKPVESSASEPLAVRLAPLIIQAVAATNAEALWLDQFDLGESAPQVTVEPGKETIAGRQHDQFSYFWTYRTSAPNRAALQVQGVRITLDSNGAPAIWEILTDSSGADIMFVAQSLEVLAQAQFGPALSGRRFSVERSLAESPRTVVARVIDDGPLPMGPVVYLQAETRDVSTVICRCMASQATNLLGQKNYELRSPVPPNRPTDSFRAGRLEQRLRLPRQF